MKTVYVVGGDLSVIKMFEETGWLTLEGSIPEEKVDLVCFTGGADVSPYLYGAENISSYCDPERDEFERDIYERFVGKVPFIGICRGGQFLNVMNGGKMIQHIDGHSMGYREIQTLGSVDEPIFTIHEDHHQGICCTRSGTIVAKDVRDGNQEIVWYGKSKSLCFQPHPEWGHEPTKELFFSLIEEYIGD